MQMIYNNLYSQNIKLFFHITTHLECYTILLYGKGLKCPYIGEGGIPSMLVEFNLKFGEG